MEQPLGRLVVVDDEPSICRALSGIFECAGYKVTTYNQGNAALEAVATDTEIDAVITDLMMPDLNGIDLLRNLRERGSDVPLLIMTAHSDVETAVAAMKAGAFDYVCKPFDAEEMRLKIERAIRQRSLQRENDYLRRELHTRYKFDNIIGYSEPMQEVYSLIAKASKSRTNVLIRGESGTGKELVARALHYNSVRAAKRFVAVSCAALPSELLESELFGHEKGAFTGALWQKAGRFELAEGGTLFLDEIGDIAPHVQIKLLRVLQEREFDRVGGIKPIRMDVRLIAASNRDLEAAVTRGDFREDLYYRVSVIQIKLPPLRERKEDIPFLVEFFLKKYGEQDDRRVRTVDEASMELLQRYDWPGNIRELENAVEHAVVMADEGASTITPELLPLHVQLGRGVKRPAPAPTAEASPAATQAAPTNGNAPVSTPVDSPPPSGNGSGTTQPTDFNSVVAETERRMLVEALESTDWNLTRAAELLGISFRSMRYNVKKHGLSREENGIPEADASGEASDGLA